MPEQNYIGRTPTELAHQKKLDKLDARDRRRFLVKIGLGMIAAGALLFVGTALVGADATDTETGCAVVLNPDDTIDEIANRGNTGDALLKDLNRDVNLGELKPGDTLHLLRCGDLGSDHTVTPGESK